MSKYANNGQYLRKTKKASSKTLLLCPVCEQMMPIREADGKLQRHGPSANPCAGYKGPQEGTSHWRKLHKDDDK